MLEKQARLAIFGTMEEPASVRMVRRGDLSLLLDGETIRSISWKGVEIVRGITWPVRDESWITLAPDIASEKLDEESDPARYEQVFSVGDGALSCKMIATFGADGTVTAEIEMTANRNFKTNRAGFTILHPLDGVAGEPLVVRHSDGTEEETVFPRDISPGQPAMDIIGLRHVVKGVEVDIAFSGEVFEMEDQRNWTDASYKTYCVPLKFPFTYAIAKGETVRQGIRITARGGREADATKGQAGLEISRGREFPEIALAMESGWEPASTGVGALAKAGVRSIQLRIGSEIDEMLLEGAKKLGTALDAHFDVEIILAKDVEPEPGLRAVASALDSAGIAPKRVIALPEPYLKSYQPSGPWPDGPTPDDCAEAARSVFGSAEIGGGMLTNFTEFNRCRPDPAQCDYVTHSTTAIVHAADDRSVLETIEAMQYVFESAVKLANGKPYRLGLVSIGMRTNPYGAGVADNPDQVRGTMAMHDPRQRGLFAAAFAVSALAAMQDYPVEAVALAGPAGPFAIVADPMPVPRPYFDDTPGAVVYPIYHVVRAAAAMSGRPRLKFSGLEQGIAAIGAEVSAGFQAVFANHGETLATVAFPASEEILILDTESFAAAVADPDWLVNGERIKEASIELAPNALAFVGGGTT